MKFAVGSKNPVKITAVDSAVKKVWSDADVIGIEVDHGTGILTNGLISRTDAFEKAVIFALARFLNPQYYK